MKRSLFLILLSAISVFLFSCGVQAPTPSVVQPTEDSTHALAPTTIQQIDPSEQPTDGTEVNDRVEEILSSMTLREKIGQMFVVYPESLGSSTVVDDAMRAAYELRPAGGFSLFSSNIDNPIQLKQLTHDIHALDDISPLIYIDEEGGNVTRLARNYQFGLISYPDMGSLSKKGSGAVYNAGMVIGSYLKAYGIDVDFAPVADVNTNPNNPVIGTRAFSSDAATAGKMVCSFLDGLESVGVAGTLKHFPGHGDTVTDTHNGYAVTQKSWDDMLGCEMLPFIAGIKRGVPYIMAAHIGAPAVTGSSIPSSLSYTVITEKLRGQLGYDGIVITDAIGMGAIANEYTDGQATVLAVKAGVDIVLLPEDYAAAYDALLYAVTNGDISVNRIDESVRRIISEKIKLGRAN